MGGRATKIPGWEDFVFKVQSLVESFEVVWFSGGITALKRRLHSCPVVCPAML